jgi:NAD(P)H-hydrate epimerase
MENAARAVALAAGEYCDAGASVCVVCGPGNNGADGLAAARHLSNAGFTISLVTPRGFAKGSLAALHAGTCRAMKLRVVKSVPGKCDLIIDALYGTGLSRALAGKDLALVEAINTHGAPVLSVDIPSGLDADTGSVLGAAVKADLTVTFVGPKQGMLTPLGAEFCGDILIADIGAPVSLARKLGKRVVLPKH